MTPPRDGDHDFNEMKLAVFDIDGTLVDSTAIDWLCFKNAFVDAFGLDATQTDWTEYRHHTDRGLVREFLWRAWGSEPSEEAICTHRTAFLRLLDRRIHKLDEIAGARAFLTVLRQRGWRITLATGAWSQSAKMKLQRAGFTAHLPISCCDLAESRDEIMRQAIGESSYERIVVFGDAPWDIRVARNLSLAFVGVGKGRRGELLRHEGATEVIPDFYDPETVMKAMRRARGPAARL